MTTNSMTVTNITMTDFYKQTHTHKIYIIQKQLKEMSGLGG
jgi:hypothetical protein